MASILWKPGMPGQFRKHNLSGPRGALECAPGAGQIVLSELTGHAGLPEDGSHGQTPYLQRRVQAPGCAGMHRRRKLARTREAARRVAQPDPDLGGEV